MELTSITVPDSNMVYDYNSATISPLLFRFVGRRGLDNITCRQDLAA